jgi:hypothetical protein
VDPKSKTGLLALAATQHRMFLPVRGNSVLSLALHRSYIVM